MILALSGVPLVIVSIIAFVLIIGVIIIVHEGGHFFFAKRAGILCHEFSIGMGPVLYKKQFGETTFCLRAIPIGGFVSMAGEEVTSELVKVGEKIGVNIEDGQISEIILDENKDCQLRGEIVDLDLYGQNNEVLFITIQDGLENKYYPVKRDAFYVFEKNKRMQITPYDRSFESKSLWKRFLTIFAGPMMNLILALIIYLIVAFATGVPNYSSTQIGEISSELGSAGLLEVGDEITAVNGTRVSDWNEFTEALDGVYDKNNTRVSITVLRNGVEETYEIEAITYIASIGLSNIQASKDALEVDGLRVGNIAIRYKDEGKKGSYPLSSGDIITKMRIDRIENGVTQEGEVISLTKDSWGRVIEEFKNTNLCHVYFEYYSRAKKGIVTIEECIQENVVIESYTNEVLDNQRIEKIQQKIGVSPSMQFDFLGSFSQAGGNFWNDFTLIFRTLKLLIAPSDVRQVGVSDLSSFVGIFSMVSNYIGAGFLSLLSFVALLSVNIGVMNLLPIPALDGGRIVFLGYELVTRRKPSKKVENIINNIFFILILILFVFITYNDILRLFR